LSSRLLNYGQFLVGMPKFAANLSWLYQDLPFLERFRAARDSGFKAVEFLFPYPFKPAEIAARLAETELTIVLFNAPPGDFDQGERGLAALPSRESDFRASVQQALEYVGWLQPQCLHIMAGITGDVEPERALETYLTNIQFVLEQTKGTELVITLEAINSRDIPGYFLTTIEQTAGILDKLNYPSLKIQLDWYHAQIMGGDLSRRTKRFFPQIGHIQVAGVPDRNEPDRGEVCFSHLFQLVDQLEYQGWIGCEYTPAATTQKGLGWLRQCPTFSSRAWDVGRNVV
jgi:2-dehydrotetronate isomerase